MAIGQFHRLIYHLIISQYNHRFVRIERRKNWCTRKFKWILFTANDGVQRIRLEFRIHLPYLPWWWLFLSLSCVCVRANRCYNHILRLFDRQFSQLKTKIETEMIKHTRLRQKIFVEISAWKGKIVTRFEIWTKCCCLLELKTLIDY